MPHYHTLRHFRNNREKKKLICEQHKETWFYYDPTHRNGITKACLLIILGSVVESILKQCLIQCLNVLNGRKVSFPIGCYSINLSQILAELPLSTRTNPPVLGCNSNKPSSLCLCSELFGEKKSRRRCPL